jgi:NADH-ubiquinone oxidoreductase chain 1
MIPFLTLFERKILRYIQIRKGPKKVSIFGIFQPIRDGIKLFFKESGKKVCSNSLIF